MAVKNKKIESYRIGFRVLDESLPFTVRDIFFSDELYNRPYKLALRDRTIRCLELTEDYVIGIIQTTQMDNLPAKHNVRLNETSELDLSNDEGLTTGNVFIIEFRRNILMFEINHQGCYIRLFNDLIYRLLNESERFRSFSIEFNLIYNLNVYNRIFNLSLQKSLEFKIANPTEVSRSNEAQNTSLEGYIDTAKRANPESLTIKLNVSAKSGIGLVRDEFTRIIQDLMSLRESSVGSNVESVKVKGYDSDDDEKMSEIDLIGDRYLKEIRLNEPTRNTDLLEFQRKNEILRIYNLCIRDFDTMFG